MPSKPRNPKPASVPPRALLRAAGCLLASLLLLVVATICFTPKFDLVLLTAAIVWAWKPFAIVLALGTLAFWLLFAAWPWRKKAVAIVAVALGILWFGKGLRDDCNLAVLASEDDRAAEIACTRLGKSLSDSRVEQLLGERDLDDNIRFYLAIIAANRGLDLESDPMLGKPGVTDGNKELAFAQQIEFPIRYKEFAKTYRSREIKP